jgi:ABC-type transporter Mla MlaB component
MLMIKTLNEPQSVTFQLEGQLTGVWVRELATAWSSVAPHLSEQPVWVDLAAVTHIDSEGLEMLTLMARHGAAIVAPDSLNQDLGEEIKTSSRSES